MSKTEIFTTICFIAAITVVMTVLQRCGSEDVPLAPPFEDFNFTLPAPEDDLNISPPFIVTEEMMVEAINRDTLLLTKINDLEDELKFRTNLLSNVMLMFKNELEKKKSCKCECK